MSPQNRNGILTERFIGADQRHVFDQRLGNQQPVRYNLNPQNYSFVIKLSQVWLASRPNWSRREGLGPVVGGVVTVGVRLTSGKEQQPRSPQIRCAIRGRPLSAPGNGLLARRGGDWPPVEGSGKEI